MRIGQIDVPGPLLDARREGSLVVFAGAGVSIPPPSNYPNFERLAEEIAAGSALVREEYEPLERFLGRLESRGVRVHQLARDRLSDPSSKPNRLHHDLLGLFDSKFGVRVVTTNFDPHFTTAAREVFGSGITTFDAPALPLGNGFEGIVHLHGTVERNAEQLVLTDGDFGRAYLTEGWASRFLQAMFARYTVLFVGYSHSDVVMNYLARGLPPDTQGRRYALTHESEPGRWNLLGVSPIVYPTTEAPNEHSALGESLGRWVRVARMGALDHEHKIREMTQLPPPLEPEDADYIENALGDLVTARFFVRHARGLEWLRWAEGKQVFRELFGSMQPSGDVSRVLAYWFAENFACEHPEEALGVIQRRGQRLNPVLWEALANNLALKLGSDRCPDARTVSKWAAVLLGSTQPESSSELLAFLLDSCRHPEDDLTALLLFERLTEPRSRLERGLSLPGMGAPRQEIEVEGEVYSLRESWERIIKPDLALFAENLEPILTGHLQRAHLLLRSTGEADDIWDPLTSSRSAIEPHEQDLRDTGVDLLVDAARDTLEWMLEHEPERAQRTIETWITKPAPLIRRLAVHGVTESDMSDPDAKIGWVLQNDLLYQYGPRHEVFRLLANAYPDASEAARLRLLERALLGPQGDDARGLEEGACRYEVYNLLVWLRTVAPDCPLATRRFEEMQRAHEDEFEPREHPDLGSYTTRLAPTRSPVTVEELLEDDDPARAIDHLLTYQGDGGTARITRGRLLETVAQAVSRSYRYGQGLSVALRDGGEWDSDLWRSIIEGWRGGNLTEEQWGQVLAFLIEHPELYSSAREISDLLQKNTSEDEDGAIPSCCLPLAETLAERLWGSLGDLPTDSGPNGTDEWLGKAINHPGGKLTECWLLILSRKRAGAGEDWHGLPSEYRRYFGKVVSGASYAAQLGRVVLTSHLFFLFSSDANWTRQNVLPLLKWSRDARRAEQAWHGFLSWGQWSEALLPDLLPLYQGAFAHVSDLPQRLRHQFGRHLASIAVYGPNDPIREGWLARFLIAVDPRDRADWAFDVGFMLSQLGEEANRDLWGRWLGEYWLRRNAGVPLPLAPEEFEKMVDWSLRLAPVFPEVARRICESLPSAVRYSRRFLSQLAESGYVSRYPEAVAELLRHALHHAPQPFWHCEHAATLLRELAQNTSVPRPVLDEICDQLGMLGCPNAAELQRLVG